MREVSLEFASLRSASLSHTSGYDKAIATYLLGATIAKLGRTASGEATPKIHAFRASYHPLWKILINRQVSNWNYPNWLGGCYQTSRQRTELQQQLI